ncbi:hypothetical protein PAAG_11470 [Paracoccidioides lutzii Pb01]|uniref:Uncharacterized protein n=1 Tax=Paracoccidioides lutzii (strain ATCC MYA-826 / Pb01) TaxID=502779 RepID=A0A0A2V5Z6_PARBA|nr:hypothetical protein PAAG_11470 [Paracoccidioides lutzii Pb01]KGQ01752.1 hypothetical protein PAAG_11470 [Paracoccidioides lutzii Pb01]
MIPQRTFPSEYMTILHLILSPGPHPTQIPENKRALWDQRESAGKCIRYLDHIVANVLEYDIERDFPVESFSWLLLEDKCDFDLRNPDRA